MALDPGKERMRLLRAYEATAYCAELPSGRVVIRVGKVCNELDEVLLAGNFDSWAFVSAANPQSVPLARDRNEERHRLLVRGVMQTGWPWYPGSGEPDEPGWEQEPSVLLLGVGIDAAIALGRQFGQRAIVFGRYRTAAALVWC